MTNYTNLSTCAATGGNLAYQQYHETGCTDHAGNPAEHLGPGTGWEQRRAFEWGYLASAFEIQGDHANASYCHARLQALKLQYGY